MCLCGGRSVFSILTCKKTREEWKNGDIPNVDVKDVPLFESFLLSSSSVCYFFLSLLFDGFYAIFRQDLALKQIFFFKFIYIIFFYFFYFLFLRLGDSCRCCCCRAFISPPLAVCALFSSTFNPSSFPYIHTLGQIFFIPYNNVSWARTRKKKKKSEVFVLWKLALGEY